MYNKHFLSSVLWQVPAAIHFFSFLSFYFVARQELHSPCSLPTSTNQKRRAFTCRRYIIRIMTYCPTPSYNNIFAYIFRVVGSAALRVMSMNEIECVCVYQEFVKAGI